MPQSPRAPFARSETGTHKVHLDTDVDVDIGDSSKLTEPLRSEARHSCSI